MILSGVILLHAAAALIVQRPPPVSRRCPVARAPTLQLASEAPTPRPTGEDALPVLVLLTGFEQFNRGLYALAAEGVRDEIDVRLFTDRDVGSVPLEEALAVADVFFASLVFDYDQVAWLSPRVERVRTRFVFESALELMSATKVGSFAMAGGGGGPPAPVKALLAKFGSGKEEDRLAGYLNFLKVGPSLLKFVPGEKAADVRLWLEAYSYWNQGGAPNVETMLRLIARRLQLGGGGRGGGHTAAAAPAALPPPVATPAIGLFHPDAPGRCFGTLSEYLGWHAARRALPADAPTVGVLLYRKHVVSALPYVGELLRGLEASGLRPLPVFINGVEAHTVVRDAFASRAKPAPARAPSPLGAARVDAVVNTIGFPLVGGPAGSMAAGRRVDVAAAILAELDVPYLVAAPLLLQDAASWRRDGVLGLQQVVLYALPELDGAVDTVVLGGLEGDAVRLEPERVGKLASRLRGWLRLRAAPRAARRLALLLYGFPPNVGATGTAALLDVPATLDALLQRLRREGYDLGPGAEAARGETLVAALAALTAEAATARGAAALADVLRAATRGDARTAARVDNSTGGLGGARVVAAAVDAPTLRGWLGGELSGRLEAQWGELRGYRGLGTQPDGGLVCVGLQLGNVFLGVQPLLGVEGDPMRLLFERDLTPHPQYAAFYEWLWRGVAADAVIHLGMHGTVEWLPGSPLGGTATSWPDRLLGGAPNVYLYAANNPSESILAKRRGYGTLVSHNVPPYARAGLYAELARVQQLLGEYRADPAAEAPLRAPIADALLATGLGLDVPPPDELVRPEGAPAPRAADGGGGAAGAPAAAAFDGERVTAIEAALAPDAAAHAAWAARFDAHARRVAEYLAALQARLFSEGLHVFGRAPSTAQLYAYLEAHYEADAHLTPPVLRAVSELAEGDGVAALVPRLLALDAEAHAWARGAAAPRHAASAHAGLDALSGERLVAPAAAAGGGGARAGARLAAALADGLGGLGLAPPRALAAAAAAARAEAAAAAARTEAAAAVALAADGGLDGVAPAPASAAEPAAARGAAAGAAGATAGDAAAAARLVEAVEIRRRLGRTTEELDAVVRALDGGYVRPGVGGDLLRDGAGVLPTGRNIHALDPFRVPSAAAAARGAAAAQRVLEQQRRAHPCGAWPETVAVALWGLNEIKTRGEAVGVVLELVGAAPVSEGTGRVVRYELRPLDALVPAGRPRVDVLASLSGIFRDSFAHVVELLDALFEAAAAADEPAERNYVRKHALALGAAGAARPASRLFCNAAGDYGSMVNERVGAGEWEQAGELGDTWQARNAFSYGRGDERGVARAEVLDALLATTERVVQMVDSVEYGLTDIQEYYANTGALKTAAEGARRRRAARGGGGGGGGAPRVGVSVVEAYARGEVAPRELEATLRMEYRTKLLNPKWAEAMAAQGSGGAYEISQRMTALVGWGATAGFTDDWAYEGAYERYVGDEAMAARLTASNPEAMRNVVRRLLEAHGRGMWESAGEEQLERLKERYQDAEDVVELGARGRSGAAEG